MSLDVLSDEPSGDMLSYKVSDKIETPLKMTHAKLDLGVPPKPPVCDAARTSPQHRQLRLLWQPLSASTINASAVRQPSLMFGAASQEHIVRSKYQDGQKTLAGAFKASPFTSNTFAKRNSNTS